MKFLFTNVFEKINRVYRHIHRQERAYGVNNNLLTFEMSFDVCSIHLLQISS